ncbi:uncharacterized protein LOC131324540 [Rhododendron vialii]|uniref:uncharacterized protein LOC131324540 n=1 Tax=Rhododendron vialii TaxID=182163 RepID=UPI0026604018|nr:uncharacterized protein LOC131324540 [Rhododendron vialii]
MALKTAAVSYLIPDDGEANQDGYLTQESIEVRVSSQVDGRRYSNVINHVSFLRCHFIDLGEKCIVNEKWNQTLEDWLNVTRVYRSYRPVGLGNRRYKIREQVKDCIRYMLYGILKLHKHGYCIDGDLKKGNVVMVEEVPKFLGLKLKKSSSGTERERDYESFRMLVKYDILEGAGANCPRDMVDFLNKLRNPLGNEELLTYHCAFWMSREKVDFFASFINDVRFLGPHIEGLVLQELDNNPQLHFGWEQDLRSGSPLHKFHRNRTDRNPTGRGHYYFLRNYRGHGGEYSDYVSMICKIALSIQSFVNFLWVAIMPRSQLLVP